MNRTSSKRVYDKVALIYNDLMKTIDYQHWAEYILAIARRFVKKNALTLEIAAGNCKTASRISQEFPNIIVTDLSLPMLCLDSLNHLDKVCCNMISLPFRIKFNFIYCAFDSVNYLLSKKELQLLFNQIKGVLSDNGIFTFDISLENNSRNFIKEQTTGGVYRGFNYKRISRYNKLSRVHSNIFYISFDGVKLKEVHKQKIFDLQTYFDCIDRAGLKVKECYDNFTFNPGSSISQRVQFVVTKDAV